MYCRAWMTLVASMALLSPVLGQVPFIPPPPQQPIIGPDGRVLSAMDRAPSPWSGGAEIGLSGTDGNTEILKIRAGLDLKYDTPENVFIFNGFYGLARQNGMLNEHKGLATARNEMPIDEAFAWFSQAQFEYDEFRDVSMRVALHSGISATAWKSEETTLKLRAGIGASRELGSANKRWLPEAQFGFDYEIKLTDRTKFVAAGDYYPDMKDFDRYRVRARISLDTLLDPDLGLLLRIGAQDRYDSFPGPNTKKNDLDYFFTLVMRF